MSAPAERRTVAVLFCDLSGFTRLSERMDPEDVRDTVDALFARFRAAIEREGGTVDKFMGDAVMAVFGAPVAHEDDPVRAVRAGLALQDLIAAFNTERGLDLRMRVGINAGEVLWGSVGGDRPTAMGDAVNVAQRLESAARPGTVLVSRAVERTARRKFGFAPAQRVKAKGRDEDVEAFEATGAHAGPAEFTNDLPSVPFVGRKAELAQLAALLERDDAAFVRVEAGPGVGKSRMLGEFRSAARRRHPGLWVAVGRAQENGRLPLSPLRDLLVAEAGVPVLDPADAQRFAAVLASQLEATIPGAVDRENASHLLARSIGVLPPGDRVHDMQPDQIRFETRAAWAAWIRSRLRDGRGLIVLEDAHWAEDAAVELMEALAEGLVRDRVAVVLTARPAGRVPRGFETMKLAELDADAAVRLAEAHLGAPASAELRDFLVQKSGGNPLFVEELARFLVDEGLARGNPVVLPAAPDRLPQGLQGLLVARLDGMGGHKEALKVASVLGRTFWRNFVARLLGSSADDAIAEAGRRGLVVARSESLMPGDEEFVFRHALLRDAAYGLLTKKERSRLHAAAADALRGGGRPQRTLAASHRESAGQTDEASREWLALAREAVEQGLLSEGASAGRRAVALGGPPEARLLAAQALNGTGDTAACLAELDALARDAGASEDLKIQGRLLESQVREFTSLADALAIVEDVLSKPLPERRKAEALVRQGVVLGSLGRRQESKAVLERALAWLGPASEPASCDAATGQLAATARHFYSTIAWHLGEYSLAESQLEASIAAWRRFGNRTGLAAALGLRGAQCLMRVRLTEASTLLAESLEVRRSVGDRAGAATSQCLLAGVKLRQRRADDARALFEGALELSRAIGARSVESGALTGLADTALFEGRLAEARKRNEEALRLRRELGDPHGQAFNIGGLLLIASLEGRYEEALAAGKEALDIYRRIDHEFNARQTELELFDARCRTGSRAAAIEGLEAIVASKSTFQTSEALYLRAAATVDTDPAAALRDALAAEPLFRDEHAFDDALNASLVAATAECRLGRPERAKPALDRLAAEPAPPTFASKLRRLEREAVLRFAAGDGPGARAAAERGAELSRAAGAAGCEFAFRELAGRLPGPG